MIIGHGGNVKELAARLGCPVEDIIDMSSNLNPLGPPPGFEDFLINSIKDIRSLPEVDAMGMIKAFSKAKDIDPSRVAPGNGTTWFIYTIIPALSPNNVLICGPAYSDYKDACIMHNIKFDFINSNEDSLFVHDIDRISNISDKYDMVFICNPNNPTAQLIDKEDLIKLIRTNFDTFFIIDESYLPFVENYEQLSLINNIEFKNLLVLSSMSKIFRIPGLRTGFLSGDPEIIRKIMHYYQPWSINCFAQKGVGFLLENQDKTRPFIKAAQKFIKKEKENFFEKLSNARTIKLFPSKTSFILAKLLDDTKSYDFCRYIADHKILIRDCSNFDGLSDKYVRFSLKTRALNNKLADLINQGI
jgi:threonine-phosphate decarboxylase